MSKSPTKKVQIQEPSEAEKRAPPKFASKTTTSPTKKITLSSPSKHVVISVASPPKKTSAARKTSSSAYGSVEVHPPIDFSFKKITDCSEIPSIEPRTGKRKLIKKEVKKVEKPLNPHGRNAVVVQRGPRTPVKSNTEDEEATSDSEKPKEESAKEPVEDKSLSAFTKGMKVQSAMLEVKKTTTSTPPPAAKEKEEDQYGGYLGNTLKLSNNMLTSNSFNKMPLDKLLEGMMHQVNSITLIDFSFNQITTLDFLTVLPQSLSVLYLHSNIIATAQEAAKLQKFTNLKTLTLHANPLCEKEKNYRFLTLALLPNLKSLDFTTVTNQDRDSALVLRNLQIDAVSRRNAAKKKKSMIRDTDDE